MLCGQQTWHRTRKCNRLALGLRAEAWLATTLLLLIARMSTVALTVLSLAQNRLCRENPLEVQ